MFGFVIPFKSKEKSKDWAQDCAFLVRTLRSVLNQNNKNFRCYVVYSDLPLNVVENEKVVWVRFPYPFLASHEIEDEERSAVQYGLGKFLPNFYDQGKKILFGAAQAKKDSCRYIMSLDADDLVSNKLVEFVQQQTSANEAGWYVNKGLMYAEGSSFLLTVPKNMNYVCASVNIIRSDLVPEPDFAGRRYEDFQFYSSHAYMVEALKLKYDIDLKPVPFYSLVYVIHHSNFFNHSNQITKFSLKNIAKRLLRGRRLSAALKKEFCFYSIHL